MATDKEIEQVERRAELAVKVATLEERSIQNQNHLGQIEKVLIKHATDEEDMLRNINTSIREFKEDVDKTIDEKIEPIQKDVSEFKTTMKVLYFVASSIAALIVFFWDKLDRIFH